MTVAATARRPFGSVAAFLDGVGDLRAVELLRIAAGPIVLIHLWPFLDRAVDGVVYSDRFTQPYLSLYPETSRGLYLALLWLAVVSAVALSLGAATRIAAAYTAGFVGYNVFLSRTHFAHNRFFLLMLLVGLALLPMGRRWSIDAIVRRWRARPPLPTRGPLWPLLLMRFEVPVVFFGSGLSKLIDPDWWGGTVTHLRVVQFRHIAAARGVPDWLLDIFVSHGFHTWFAKVAVITELVIAFGLLARRTRLAAVWIAIPFHISIEIIASVEVFSYAALAALVIWITPSAEDRTVVIRASNRPTRALAWAVRRLDWTGRFRLVAEDGGGDPVTLIDRDGRVSTGGHAARMVLSRLPVTFWFAAPLNLAGLRRLWDRTTAAAFDIAAGENQVAKGAKPR